MLMLYALVSCVNWRSKRLGICGGAQVRPDQAPSDCHVGLIAAGAFLHLL